MIKTCLLASVAVIGVANCQSQNSPQPVAWFEADVDQNLVGTWVGGAADGGGGYVVKLQLNSDGSYQKTLTATTADHQGYGGTHRGTWKSRGMVVYLSGDGNWPPYSHDLSTFQKVN